MPSTVPQAPPSEPFQPVAKAARPVPPPAAAWAAKKKVKVKLRHSEGGIMAAESYRKRLQDEITCFVCLDYFTAPVTLDCGHNFCRGCIVKSWGDSPKDVACPQCRERVEAKKLRPNKQLANMVQIAKELSSLLKHSVVPVEEAAQECKICLSLEILRKERGTLLVYKAENERESQALLKQMEAEKKKTAAAFRQLHQFLEEQEKLLQTKMEEVEKEIAKRREENLTRLSGELSSLDCLIREMEEKQQQSVNELLQNIGNILERCQKEAFENPVAFPVVLKWKVHDFSDINPFLEALMKQFKDSLVSGLPLHEAKVTLDPATAHPELILSEDCKSVRWKDEWQNLPDNPERFDYLPFVLGREGFTAGRHCWNVEVGCEEEWSVGVAKKSMRRKGDFDSGPEEGIWDMGMWDGGYRISVSPERPRLSLSHELKTIRVTLNCAGGRVAFFNADTGVALYVYSDTALCRETLLPFFWVAARGHLKICS